MQKFYSTIMNNYSAWIQNVKFYNWEKLLRNFIVFCKTFSCFDSSKTGFLFFYLVFRDIFSTLDKKLFFFSWLPDFNVSFRFKTRKLSLYKIYVITFLWKIMLYFLFKLWKSLKMLHYFTYYKYVWFWSLFYSIVVLS